MISAHALRILVVDDDSLQLRATARLLKALGHHGALASRGLTALDLVDRQAFDVVLLDLRMPEMDGSETLSRLRQRQPSLPVVLVSGDDLGESWPHYRAAGAHDHLTKPLDVEALDRLLKTFMR